MSALIYRQVSRGSMLLVVSEDRAYSPNVERSRRFNGIQRDFLRGRLVEDGAGAAHAAIG